MITLKDSVEIQATPDKIFEWFKTIDKHYKEWHPRDHVKWVNLTGDLEEGSVVYNEEYLHGKLYKFKFVIVKIEPEKRVECRFLFPLLIFNVRGSFEIESKGDRSIFTANIYFGYKIPVIGSIIDELILLFGKSILDAIEKHQREEGENLKKLLEGKKE